MIDCQLNEPYTPLTYLEKRAILNDLKRYKNYWKLLKEIQFWSHSPQSDSMLWMARCVTDRYTVQETGKSIQKISSRHLGISNTWPHRMHDLYRFIHIDGYHTKKNTQNAKLPDNCDTKYGCREN